MKGTVTGRFPTTPEMQDINWKTDAPPRPPRPQPTWWAHCDLAAIESRIMELYAGRL